MLEATVLTTALCCLTSTEYRQVFNCVVLMMKVSPEGRKLILASLVIWLESLPHPYHRCGVGPRLPGWADGEGRVLVSKPL